MVNDFMSYMSSKEIAEKTLLNYRCDLNKFLHYMEGQSRVGDRVGEWISEVTLSDLHTYLAYLKQSGLAKSSRARHVATLKSWWKYLYKMGVVKENVAIELESPKLDKRQPIFMNVTESKQLLDAALSNERDFAVLILFLNCGLRISEMAGLRLGDIRDYEYLLIRGKGSKERTVPLNDITVMALKDYVMTRGASKDDHVFLSRLNAGMTTMAIRDIVKKYIDKAGLDSKFSPHKLRTTCATLLHKHGKVDIRTLQELLGHANINTTTVYVHSDTEMIIDAVDSNPLNSAAHISRKEDAYAN